MTDDQLQSLFAGMQRHLDKRIDELEKRFYTKFDEVNTKFDEVNTKIDEVNTKIDTKIEALETKLLSEFWKWGRAVEARMRMHDAINAATLERLSSIEERVLNLEKPRQ